MNSTVAAVRRSSVTWCLRELISVHSATSFFSSILSDDRNHCMMYVYPGERLRGKYSSNIAASTLPYMLFMVNEHLKLDETSGIWLNVFKIYFKTMLSSSVTQICWNLLFVILNHIQKVLRTFPWMHFILYIYIKR